MFVRCLVGCTAALLLASSVYAADIGAIAAVNRDVQGTRPAEQPRRLVLNEKLIQNERVTTTAESGGQVLFLDQTTLTLTPNSDIILDKYVFDPASDKGELAVTMLKGAMRMVGGRITKSSAATIRTPSATIGIRGGIGNITVNEDGSTEYMHIAGFSATITSTSNQSITITREGGMAEVGAPAGGVQAFVSEVTGATGGGAGTGTTVVDRETQGGDAPGGDQTSGNQASGNQPSSDQASGDQPSGDQTAENSGGSGQSGTGGQSETDTPTAATGGDAADPASGDQQAGGATGGDGQTGGAVASGEGGGGGGGGKITYLGVATPEQVRSTMSKRAGSGDGGSSNPNANGQIQSGVKQIELAVSGRPNAITNAPISTTGERQEDDFDAQPIRLDVRPIEEFTDNAVAMATEAERAAQEIAQELNAVSFAGVWSATAGLNSGGFTPVENDLAFRLRYSLLDQQGFVTIQLPGGGVDGATLTTFDGATVIGDRFLLVGDDAQNLVADTERLTLLGGNADGSALIISPADIANGSVFVDYEGAGLSQLQFVDGVINDLDGQRINTISIRDEIANLRQTLGEPGN